MTKTLADMTPAERAECVGMWCEYPNTRDRLGIIYDLDDDNDPWILRFDVRIEILGYDAKDTIPRFDLPRAWSADGKPVKGRWAEGHMWWGEDADDGNPVDVVGAECLDTGAIEGFKEWPDSVTPGEDVDVRRFIYDWEEIPNA